MEQMEEMLLQRKEGLHRVEKLMEDVHTVATQIGVEVKTQKDKLIDIDANVDKAKDNVEKGNDQLE